MPNEELELVPQSEASRIDELPRADAVAIWDGYREKAMKLKATAETLVVTDISQRDEMKLARTTRLTLKNLRVEIEGRRKELGEEALRRKQKIDAAAKELKDIIEPLEERLLEQEQFAERAEAAAKAELKTKREAEILPLRSMQLPTMSTAAGRTLLEQINDQLAGMADAIDSQSASL